MSSADKYNADRLATREIKPGHVTAMTIIAQRELGLTVDGKCGPKTCAALEAQSAPAPTGPRALDVETAAGLLAAYPEIPPLAAAAVEIALSLRGRGEEGENNHGPFIEFLGGRQGMLWCALFAGYAWREAYRRNGQTPPAWLYRRPGVPEPGARALVHGAAAAGRRFTDPGDALPGDLALWKRTGGYHVGLVWRPLHGGAVATVEGNVGRFPAVVRDLVHDTHHEPNFVQFARPW